MTLLDINGTDPVSITRNIVYSLGKKATDILPNLLISLGICVVFFFVGKFIKRWYVKAHMKVAEKRATLAGTQTNATDKRTASIVGGILQAGCLAIGCLVVVESLNLGGVFTKIFAGIGVLGIILGVSLQGISSSLFAGFLLNVERPFKAGDYVVINDVEGTVEDIGVISTRLTSITGETIFVPNQTIFSKPFRNLNASGKRRVVINATISCRENLERVRAITLEEIEQLAFVDRSCPQPQLFFTKVNNSVYEYSIRFWINTEEEGINYLFAQSEAIIALKKRYENENVRLSFPTNTTAFEPEESTALLDATQVPSKP